MPVEIRELIIKTEVTTKDQATRLNDSFKNVDHLKQEILSACKRMLKDKVKRAQMKR